MKGYERSSAGSAGSSGSAEGSAGFAKAKPLPAVASGDQVEVRKLLEECRHWYGRTQTALHQESTIQCPNHVLSVYALFINTFICMSNVACLALPTA
jgi:hypothetical protein